MTTLELVLASALALTCGLLFRLYRKHLILRHVFIHYSDWCALKVEEVARSATDQITQIAMEHATERGWQLSESEAREGVNYIILNATNEWQAEADAMQARLERNGLRPLDMRDLDDLIWSPWIAGIKH